MNDAVITPAAPVVTDPALPPGFDPAKLVIPDAQEQATTTPGSDSDPGQVAEIPRLAEPPANPKDGQAYTDNYGRKQTFTNGQWEVTDRPKYYIEPILDTDGNVLVEGGERTFEELQQAVRDSQNVQNFVKINQKKSTEMGQMIKALQPLMDGLGPLAGDGIDASGKVIPGSKLESTVDMITELYGADVAKKFVDLAKYKPAEFEDPIRAERDQLKAEKTERENRELVDNEFKKMATTRKIDETTAKKVREHWLKKYEETGRVVTPDDAYLSYMDKYGKSLRPPAPEVKPLPSVAGVAGIGGLAAKLPANIAEAMDQLSKTFDPSKLIKR